MILGDLIGLVVRDGDGRKLGKVNDVRLVATPSGYEVLADTHVFGLIVSPHGTGSNLGYERTGVRAPALIAALARWHHRGSFLIRWEDVAAITRDGVVLRTGHRRYDPALPD
jgi:sporulation protein YlmC with PRC-barrel domain